MEMPVRVVLDLNEAHPKVQLDLNEAHPKVQLDLKADLDQLVKQKLHEKPQPLAKPDPNEEAPEQVEHLPKKEVQAQDPREEALVNLAAVVHPVNINRY